MVNIKKSVLLFASLAVSVYTVFVVVALMKFLSTQQEVPRVYNWLFNMLDNKSSWELAFGAIFFDTLYVVAFIWQHSLMSADFVKRFIHNIGLGAAERSIYNLTSSLCLHYLVRNWLPAQSIAVWHVNTSDSPLLRWTFVAVHALAWLLICGGSFLMDVPELLGLKQTYYDLKDYAMPMAYKPFDQRRLLAHVRHPSFVCLSVILWATNLMTIDRFILATLLTVYMYVAWTTDRADCIYQRVQLRRKLQT